MPRQRAAEVRARHASACAALTVLLFVSAVWLSEREATGIKALLRLKEEELEVARAAARQAVRELKQLSQQVATTLSGEFVRHHSSCPSDSVVRR